MVSLTLSIAENFKNELKAFPWINWSEFAREEALKKLIFERYIKTKELSDEDWEFCEKIDWHPVDELPLKPEFVKQIETAKKEKGKRYASVSDFFKEIDKKRK